jgi:hypothetical protein
LLFVLLQTLLLAEIFSTLTTFKTTPRQLLLLLPLLLVFVTIPVLYHTLSTRALPASSAAGSIATLPPLTWRSYSPNAHP